eukprot:CAMPEP_0115274398 /NCGR_PEP_ID=MMETSP0270-20121206/55654_1 /TAXON_ID=71861 /ORGANISM="Scrippsiella trochoidea, Strain CCMP3099" /LENGTH=119 /DNA_ID=CAMNT_0002690907 /DNA_START=254 /DNA_END=613 /DNA_ORIENTATION=+
MRSALALARNCAVVAADGAAAVAADPHSAPPQPPLATSFKHDALISAPMASTLALAKVACEEVGEAEAFASAVAARLRYCNISASSWSASRTFCTRRARKAGDLAKASRVPGLGWRLAM